MNRTIAFALLDDQYGISNEAWELIRDQIDEDIRTAIITAENRVFLPDGDITQELRAK